jgi:hypothetical protein
VLIGRVTYGLALAAVIVVIVVLRARARTDPMAAAYGPQNLADLGAAHALRLVDSG